MIVDALRTLEQRALETSTTGLLIWRDGQTVSQFGEDIPVPLFSMTKSIVSLAIGFLFDEDKIESLDTPVSRWFTERADWQQGAKSIVTIRMLLTHTSGIQDHFIEADGGFNLDKFNAFQALPDVIEAAMKLKVVKEPPGSHASYSNSSADILVALVNRISKMRIDAYINEKLFKPLKITNWQWVSSTKQLFGTNDTTPSGADGLVLSAQDLLKIGQMILQDGKYEGKQVISAQWIQRMSSEVPNNCLTMELGQASGTNLEKYCAAFLWMVPESLAKAKSNDVFMGWGFLGQYLMILRSKKIVAIRLYSEGLPDITAHEKNSRASFADFEYLVRRL